MPPILALILCSTFVLFLLRLERKQSPDMSRVLWIPTIWMLYTASKPFGTWFPSSGALLETSPLDQTFLIILMCIALWILIRRRFDWLTAMKENTWLMVLIVFMLVSILWSSLPYISFKRWVREIQAIILAFVVLSESSPRQAMESILRRTVYILIPFSLLLIKYFPEYGIQYGVWTGRRMWIGVSTQKNGLVQVCIIAAFFLIWSLVKRWKGNNVPVWKYQTYLEIFVLFLSFWLILGEEKSIFSSATSIYALFVALLFYLVFNLMKKAGINFRASLLMTIVAIIILMGIVTLFVGGTNVSFFASAAGRDSTLTGRTEIWASLLPFVMQKPIIGSGFGGFWTSKTKNFFQINQAHNGYLDMLLQLGFVGILLVSIFLLSSCRKAHRELTNNFDWSVLWICYIIMALIHNVGESSIDSLTNLLPAIILFFTISSTTVLSNNRQS